MSNRSVLLLVLHNTKALGVGFLEKALTDAGYDVTIGFFKSFSSVNPKQATPEELELLCGLVREVNPGFIGLSVISSQYLETVFTVNDTLRDNFDIPVVWGSVFATLFPEKCLENTKYVLRGEGEGPIVSLADALLGGKGGIEDVPNLSYIKDGKIVHNPMAPLCANLDELGYPAIGGKNRYFINAGKMTKGDPMLDSMSYETSASRGCPFNCSYCCSSNLRKVYAGQKYLRFRSVDSLMTELVEAKSKLKKLKYIHFWDEIFSNEPGWVDEFARRYKKEINLPFEIWVHPLMLNEDVIRKLVSVGLFQIVMGIQSGSPRVRKDIFRRNEKQEDILRAAEIFKRCKVPHVVYDFILRHDFETWEDLKITYELCAKLPLPFELQLHGLNFFHGIDIVDMAIERGLYTREELDAVMSGPMAVQYGTYWGQDSKDDMTNFWYGLVYLTQFGSGRRMARRYAGKADSPEAVAKLLKKYKSFAPLARAKRIRSRLRLMVKGFFR